MSNPKTGPRQLKPGPYQAKAVAWQYDGSHAILWCDKSKGGEHWRRLDEQCNGRFPEPDAKLMAAAHDLLDALQTCLTVLHPDSLEHAKASAAIAKAKAGSFSLITGDAPADAQCQR